MSVRLLLADFSAKAKFLEALYPIKTPVLLEILNSKELGFGFSEEYNKWGPSFSYNICLGTTVPVCIGCLKNLSPWIKKVNFGTVMRLM